MRNKTQSSGMNTSINDNYRTSPRRDWNNDDIWQIKMPNYRKLNDFNAKISTENGGFTQKHKNEITIFYITNRSQEK